MDEIDYWQKLVRDNLLYLNYLKNSENLLYFMKLVEFNTEIDIRLKKRTNTNTYSSLKLIMIDQI